MNITLKNLREEKGLSQADVATILGITRAAYAHYEQNIREPSIEIIKKLCQVYNVSADELLGLVEYGEKEAISYELTPKEAEIVLNYRNLSEKRKRQLITAAQTFLELDEKERQREAQKA